MIGALIKSDSPDAAFQAGNFLKAIKAVDMKVLSAADMDAFMALNEKLSFDARHISESNETREISNPYLGQKMQECGSVKEILK